MTDQRDRGAGVLMALVPVMFGLHSTWLPWLTVDSDDASYASWDVAGLRYLEDSAYAGTWTAVLVLGSVVSLWCVGRAFLDQPTRSWWLAALCVLLALALLALPFVATATLSQDPQYAAAVSSGTEDIRVRWGAPVLAAMAALAAAVVSVTGPARHPDSSPWWRSDSLSA